MVHKPKRAKQPINYDRLPLPRDYYTQHLPGLRPQGYWTLTCCPFHDSKTPNLTVNLLHGAFRCFTCGANGSNVLAFHQQLKNLSLKAAAIDLDAWGKSND